MEIYRILLQTTDVQKAYQEFIRLFRFLGNELERQMPDFRFQSSITENAIDYAYFTFTIRALIEKGLGSLKRLRGQSIDLVLLG